MGFFRSPSNVITAGNAQIASTDGNVELKVGSPTPTPGVKVENDGQVVIGNAPAAAAALLTVEGVLALKEQTVIPPGAPHVDSYGRLYAKNDDQLYFLDDAGLETQLTTPGGGPPIGGGWSDIGTTITLTTATDRVGIGGAPQAATKFEVRGDGTTSGTYALKVTDQSGVAGPLFYVRDDGQLEYKGTPMFNSGLIFIDKQTPTGTINGINAVFTLANSAVVGSEHVFVNGNLAEEGAGQDYTISGATITFEAGSEPPTGSRLLVSYRK